MVIRTKIVATIGPACGEPAQVGALAQAGCDVFRINFSHGTDEERLAYLQAVRQAEADLGAPLAIMADLCGPKIRVGTITGGSVLLAEGQQVAIQRAAIEGQADRVSVTLEELIDAAAAGDAVLMDDGRIQLEVVDPSPADEIVCRVVRGGVLASGKGVNLPHTKLKLSSLTDKDRRDVAWIAEQGEFDYVAMSFVRTASDLQTLRKALAEAGCAVQIVAKIEKPEALDNLQDILEAADALMVARGDLGVEMDLPEVPVAQKRISRLCQAAGKPCIIATQMLESMTHGETPTRAEVSDVANAVLDHADAVMLSGETAVGKNPAAAVRMMNGIVASIQAFHDETYTPTAITHAAARQEAALAAAVREIVAVEAVEAVAVFTISGRTALMFAKNRLPVPILALTPREETLRRMCLYYGCEPALVPTVEHTREILALAGRLAVQRGIAKVGSKIVVISGRPIGKPGATNTLAIHTVG